MVFAVTFWGVRGSIACSGPQYVQFGGNTMCLELRLGNERLIIDAGTGIAPLGQKMTLEEPSSCHLLLSHAHWDHICGFPFFAPAYDPRWNIHIHSGSLSASGGVKQVLSGQMQHPYFPVPISVMSAKMVFNDFHAGESFYLNDEIVVKSVKLNHPGGATGYRLEWKGKSLAFVCDVEHDDGACDDAVRELMKGAHLALYDASYTQEEYKKYKGYGHSTWEDGIRLAQEAGVRRLGLIHHEPAHDDTFLINMEREVQARWSQAFLAKQGETIYL